MSRYAIVGLVLFSSACTFEDGGGFARIDSAKLSARFDPGVARNLNGALLTDQGYQIRFSTLRLAVQSAELLALAETSSQAASFDPASPPPGYSLCHGGHCHADDGRLVAYADIEAELAGGSVSFTPVVALDVNSEFDLLSFSEQELRSITPSRELPETRLRKAVVTGTRFIANGEVTSGAMGEGTAELSVALEALPVFELGVDVDISRDGPEELDLRFGLKLDGTLFDGIDFAALAEGGSIHIQDPDAASTLSLASKLANAELSFTY